ncbi:hypothetical protein [Campylobacter porcelli]|uniref:Uncharacterized protein n=1 Tax=Campylobacter porcelli TaxID=1660073 RepID=A0A1X9SVL9_9BACT|nr:hypothetical protein [Campylobacter sp. RM6137]ARR00307.1 hypothetical protein CSUIS_0468 [Campylobacter sp. RM6137]
MINRVTRFFEIISKKAFNFIVINAPSHNPGTNKYSPAIKSISNRHISIHSHMFIIL